MHVTTTSFWAKLIYFCAFVLLPVVGWAQGTEICNNGKDDDGDNLVDCQDPDCPECARFINCVEPNTCYMPPIWANPTAGNFNIFGTQDVVLSTNADFTAVTIRTLDGSFTKTVVVTATGSTIVSIPTSAVMSNSPNTVQKNKGLIITSTEPVQATYRLTAALNQDIVPLKCRAALGYAFYTGSQTRLTGTNGIDERHFVGVMATQPNTVVTFRSPIALEGVSAALGSPFSVTLNTGETYLLTTKVINSSSTENKSVSGILVTSDQPIVVNSGSQHNYQPYSGNRDAGIDQLVPARITGQNYVAVHGENKTSNADYVIVVGIETNTSVSISGPATAGATTSSVLATTTIGPGGVFTYNLPDIPNRAFSITTGKRAYVYHVSSYAANEFGMGILPSINPCNGGKRTDFYRTSGSSNDQAVVLIPTAGLSSLMFRGSPYTTYGTVVDKITVNGVEQSVVSFPNASIATAENVNTITSNERFHVGVVSNTGGASTGNYGFYSNYEAKVDVLNPDTNQPDDFYTVATVDVNVANQHCLKMTSCGTTNTITKILSGSLTQSATFDPATNCISYTMKSSAPICGRDTIRVAVVNDLGKEGIICLEYINKRSDLIVGTIQSASFVCQPTATPVSFTVVAQSSGGKYGYQWITPDKQILSTSVITGALPGRYIITVGDGNTCSDTRSLTLAADTPTAIFTGLGSTTVSTCGGATATYSVSATPGSLLWTVTSGTIVGPASGTSVTVRWNVVSSSTTGVLRVSLTSPNGCQTAVTQNVTIFALPALSATGTNPGCSGANNGRIDLTVSGGTAPYTYRWSNGTTAEDPSGLTAGVYSVTVTDKNNCAAAQPLSVTLTNPTTFTVLTAQTNPRCFGAATGTASITVSGGSPGYGYTWSNGRTTASVSGLTAGSYTVTICDVNNCITTRVFSLTQPPALVLTPTTQNPACNGAATGSVSVSASGGVGGYGYRWITGATASSISGLPTGTYSVTVTDFTSCTGTATAMLTQPTALSLTATTTNLTCFGQPTGRVDLTASGGTGPYSYNWTNGAITEDLSGLSAGTYSVTVTDGGNCTGILTTTITQPNRLTANAVAGIVSCANGNDGAISLTVGGGTGAYRFQWSDTQPGNTSQNRTGLTAGTYSVTITDANNCQTTATATLTNPVGLSAQATVTNSGCSGAATGSISITATGGTGPYSYSWNTGATSRNITNLVAGEYAVTVTDARGCTIDLGAAVLQPRPLSTTVLSTSANCPGGTGMITVEVRGGTEAYRYLWSNGATTATIYQLPASGTPYSLTVTDANNCTATTQATISQPPAFALNAVVKPVACNGAANGEINLTVEGGTPDYTYLWNNGRTTEDLTGLVAGVYSVTVTDRNNCKQITSVNVQEPTLMTLTESHTAVACFGGQTGAINLTVSGGTSPFSFEWKNQVGEVVGSIQDLNELSAGIYRVVVTDKNGCTSPLSVTITQQPGISLTLYPSPVACNGDASGAIDLVVSGGTGAFTYQWNTGATTEDLTNIVTGVYSVTATDANGCPADFRTTVAEPSALTVSVTKEDIVCKTGATGRITLTTSGGTPGYQYRWQDPDGSTRTAPADRTGLVAGVYSVTATDFTGCRKTVAVTLTEPTALTVTPTAQNIGCFGGSDGNITIVVSGGTPGAGYGFTWADNISTQNRQNLSAGTYSLTVTDVNRCLAQTSVTLTQPPALSVVAAATAVRCNGGADGAISLTVLGGTGSNYVFAWRDSEALSPVTSQNRTGLDAGSYAVIVTDQNQCSRGVSLSVSQPEALQVSLLPSPVSCFGGADGMIRSEVSGGITSYRYQWSDISPDNTNPNRNGLVAGVYSLTVTDANDCQRVISTTISQPTAISLSAQTVPVTCNSGNTGAIDLTVSGGELPYRYNWNTLAVTEDLANLTAGSYSVTVTDNNGCISTLSVTISQPTDLIVITDVTNNRCSGDHTGAIRLRWTGGSGTLEQFRFGWMDQYGMRPETTSDLQALPAGSYTVVLTDANGCTALQTATLTEPPMISITAVTTDVLCFGGSDGAVDISVSGGVPVASGLPYQYIWDRSFQQFQSNDEDIAGKPADVYSFSVTDANGCRQTAVVTISQPNALTLTLSGINPSCNDGSTGAVNLTVLGGTGPYRYQWNTGSTTQSLTALSVGTFTVTVTDANQCQITQSVSLTQPASLSLIGSTTPDLCFSGNTGTASITVLGGTPATTGLPYRYLWRNSSGNPVSTSASVTGLVAGSYSVVVTDGNGCSATQSLTVTQPNEFSVTTQLTDLLCFNGKTGAIRLQWTGGTGTNEQHRFDWYDATGLRPETTPNLQALPAGSYTVVVTDANGCTATTSATLRQPTALTVSALPTDAPCFGSTGQITVEVRGGSPDYLYLWSNGSTGSTVFGLTATTAPYTLTVTDANGCTATTSATINQPPNFALNGVVVSVACNGGNTGSVNLTVEGGTPGYRYLWSNGATTQDVSGLSAGPISVTVLDANNCRESTTFNLSEPGSLVVSVSSSPVLCFGGNTGTASLTALVGTQPYRYQWNTGAITASITSLSAGSYSVVVSDANGCTISQGLTISQPTALSVSLASSPVLCFGGSTGITSVSVSGGTGSYAYLWNTGAITASITSLSVGSYSVVVSDANGCSATTSATINQPTALTATGSIVPVACFGQTGSVNLTVEGGTPDYRYIWDSGATTQDVSGLASGSYSVTVVDANGCLIERSFNLSQPGGLSVLASSSPVLCFRGATGSASVTASGGTLPYQYQWSTGATTANISSVSAGTYSVVVRDGNGCSFTDYVSVTEPSALSLALTQVNASCNGGATGSLSITALGGRSPYSYSWNTGATTQTILNLRADEYTVTITDANGCLLVVGATIEQPLPLSTTVLSTSANCAGGTGMITVEVLGGVPAYRYLWSNGSTASTVYELPTGGYSLTVSDANSCTATTQAVVNQPPVFALNAVVKPVLCQGGATGEIDLTVEGGTSPYGYQWSNGQTSQDVSGLVAGVYSVTVTDRNGCKELTAVNLGEPGVLTLTESHQDVVCFGQPTGGISLSVAGGTAPYSFSWTDGIGQLVGTTAALEGLAGGTYRVLVSDGGGCVASLSVVISQPLVLSVASQTTPALYAGSPTGSASISVSGGTQPYQYLWNTGATTSAIGSLSVGGYSVVVSDKNGCLLTHTLSITSATAVSLSLTLGQTNLRCVGSSNGAVSVMASGGNAPYQYLWSTGATTASIGSLSAGGYSVVVTDAGGQTATATASLSPPLPFTVSALPTDAPCFGQTGQVTVEVRGSASTLSADYTYLWSNGSTGATIYQLPAGTYSLTVTNTNGCTATTSATVVVPPAFALNGEVLALPCQGGASNAIDLTVEGGTPGYKYLWSNGATTEDLVGVLSGLYSVTVTDGNDCRETTTFNLSQPGNVSVVVSSIPATCFGTATGSVSVTASGGSVPYSYQLVNRSGNGALVGANVYGLSVGSYSVVVSDFYGCRATQSFTISQPNALSVNGAVITVSCNGGNTGSVNLTVEGGTPDYRYIWDSGATTQDVSGLVSGSYSVTVTDANGCLIERSFNLSQPGGLSVTASSSPVLCFGGATRSASVTASGGTLPYQYLWNTGATTASISSLSAGTYSVVVRDKNGCSFTDYVSVTEPSALSFALTQVNASCNGGSTGSLSITALGGTGLYSYSWNTGAITQTIGKLRADEYTVTLTDANGCLLVVGATIEQPLPLSTTVLSTSANCAGGTGMITVEVLGGVPAYRYLWSNGSTASTVYELPTGGYSLTVTDANGCTATTQAVVNQPPVFALNAVVKPVLCQGGATGEIDLTVEGGTSPYGYQWSNGQTSQDVSGLVAGVYSVTVTDRNGCKELTAVNLGEPAALTLTESHQDVVCFGQPTGGISLSVAGGTAPYSFSWTDGTGQSVGTTAALEGLAGGTYRVLVSDGGGCVASLSVVISQPPALSVASQTTPALYAGSPTGSASISISGGTQPYQYLWNTGATTSAIGSLSVGGYSVVVSDKNGCLLTHTLSITSATAVSLSLTLGQTNLRCVGSSNGAISVTASGGNMPYQYLWSTGATTASIGSLSAGGYSVVVTDAGGQTATATASLSPPLPFTVSALPTDAPCFGQTGQVTVEVRGSAPTLSADYTYRWSNGSTGATIYQLPAGTYSLTVTNANGCTATTSATVVVPPAFALNGEVLALPCSDGKSNAIDLTVEGGTPGYKYLWSNGATTEDLVGVLSGLYSVTVTDGNDCRETTTFNLSQPGNVSVVVSSIPATCFGTATGSVSVTASGGSVPYSYQLVNRSGNGALVGANVYGLSVGSYWVVVSDFYGCRATQSFTISQPNALSINLVAVPVSCSGATANADGKLILQGFQPGDRYDLVVGATYNGQATPLSNLPVVPANGVLRDALPNPTLDQPYSVRVINQAGCAADALTTLRVRNCQCRAPDCVPFQIQRTRSSPTRK